MPRHPSFLFKIKIIIFYISLFLSLSLSLSLYIYIYSSLFISLSLTSEEGVRTLASIKIQPISLYLSLSDRWRGCVHPCNQKNSAHPHFCLHVHALNVPHSVSQSASVIIILIWKCGCDNCHKLLMWFYGVWQCCGVVLYFWNALLKLVLFSF